MRFPSGQKKGRVFTLHGRKISPVDLWRWSQNEIISPGTSIFKKMQLVFLRRSTITIFPLSLFCGKLQDLN